MNSRLTDFDPEVYKGFEVFMDSSYFNQWAVRRRGELNFEKTIHVLNEKSARNVIDYIDEGISQPKKETFY